MMMKRGNKLGYALPLNTDYQSFENLKTFKVTVCPLHANQDCILKKINDLMCFKKSETKDGLSRCSNFAERPTDIELAVNKPVLPEIEHQKGKIMDK